MIYLSFRRLVAVGLLAIGCAVFSGVASLAAEPSSVPAPPLLTVGIRSGGLGSEQVSVSGTAPAGGVVVLDVWATISKDLPTIHIATVQALADRDGQYAATILTAPVFERGAILHVVANLSYPQATQTASAVLAAPNAANLLWDDQ